MSGEPIYKKILNSSVVKVLDTQFNYFKFPVRISENELDLNLDVDLNFEINKNGKVQQIKVIAKDSRFSRGGTDCMAQVLSVIDFPRPKGGGRVAVRQPLNFFAEKERG